MKKFKVIAVLAIAFCFLFGTTAVYGYGHGISVSGGTGSIAGGDISATVVTFAKGDIAKVNGKEITPPSPSDKYFATGLKLAGHDNSEVFDESAILDVQEPSSLIYNQDAELVVAYGLKSNMVKYTISYVDAAGAELLPSETHYGVIDQEPIVSYKYVEGYLPNAYNAKKTLSEDVSQNVITFTYTQVQAAEGNTIINNNGNANAAAGNAAAGNAAAGNAAAGNAAGNAGTAIGDNATPLAINDQDTPLANADQEEEGGGGSALPYIIGGVAVAAIIAAIAAFLARRRAAEEE